MVVKRVMSVVSKMVVKQVMSVVSKMVVKRVMSVVSKMVVKHVMSVVSKMLQLPKYNDVLLNAGLSYRTRILCCATVCMTVCTVHNHSAVINFVHNVLIYTQSVLCYAMYRLCTVHAVLC